ncbi:acetyl-CoA carboxylase, biotin carboxyl carrier protein [Candidatus Poribacteria bacterium]|nr:acetyl-CoA carboxylase, biotin carboxyl carrier protein [Candidatus Poribacteria bacterium]
MRQNRSKDKSENEVLSSESAEQDYSDVLELVEQLAEVLDRADLTEVRIRDNEFEVQVSRERRSLVEYEQPPLQRIATSVATGTPQIPLEDTDVEVNAQPENEFINAPMPSRFYRSPTPEEPPFVEVGDAVTTGEPVAVLEVMKTYNPVEAPFNCEIVEILVEDGDAVEYAQPLFRVKQT